MTHNYLIADDQPLTRPSPGSRLLRMPRGQIRSSPFYSFALVWLCLFAVMQAQAQFPAVVSLEPVARVPMPRAARAPALTQRMATGRRSDFD